MTARTLETTECRQFRSGILEKVDIPRMVYVLQEVDVAVSDLKVKTFRAARRVFQFHCVWRRLARTHLVTKPLGKSLRTFIGSNVHRDHVHGGDGNAL